MPMGDPSPEEIGHSFIDAFNRRDGDGLVELCDPAIEFYPTLLVGERRVYHGHDGLRRWVAELEETKSDHQVRVREVRVLEPLRFLVLSEVVFEGDVVTPSAMVARLAPSGGIVEARAYLSDEELLTKLGIVPPQS